MRLMFFVSMFFFLVNANLSAQNTIEKNIYQPEANAEEQINQAIALAKKENKHVFVQIGGNWCPWCLTFNHLLTTNEELKNTLRDHYKVVHLNYSKENKNLPMLAKLRHPERFGFPVFVILDGNGKLLHTQNSAYLENKDGTTGHDPKIVKDFLEAWTYKALDPATYESKK
ncbi:MULTISPECIES: thioredoxin family protein [Weeksella]|uniref:Thioredoxin domain-containing protein n=2 Tax=Weeksella virosa TaxID=1014 RepID=F0P0D6_WEEVC|nr:MULTISPECIES: thioredoxin family protein [Weeksella]ADX67420.1 hypothetical protein Weevi_0705 [Weeksella virosa DSM 16922]MDK7374352.1 thioredoxin family protein [Weeksella virosa]MDK7675701.1 thioredoxin family protein [Weeksella virosa]OFM81940.1 hypothetical protein HMPREF2660_05120 [Weeksella sp. HMSC059D05]SUP53711.1 Thioredoxin-related protein [Weeksella virosa]